VEAVKPQFVLEIGTAGGGSLFLLSQGASEDALVISVDLPYGQFGGGYQKIRIPLYRAFARPKQKIHLVRDDSHDMATLKKVEKILSGNKLDLLFIDGDHSYEGVSKDFQMYHHLVKKNGIIAFHDIVPGDPKDVGGCPEFWAQIKKQYKYLEIVKDWHQGRAGIGVIYP
jgi:predicted O-methyltransferase YrrM